MRNIVVRLKEGDAYQAKADTAELRHSTTHLTLEVKLGGQVIAVFFADSIAGYWWQDEATK